MLILLPLHYYFDIYLFVLIILYQVYGGLLTPCRMLFSPNAVFLIQSS